MNRLYGFLYSIKQGFIGLKRHRMFTLASVGTVAACLFLFGVFYFLLSNFGHIIRQTQTSVGVTVFFEEGVGEDTISKIGEAIASRSEVDHFDYISAEEAWERFKAENFADSPDLIESFGNDNPLKDSASYEIYLKNISDQGTLVSYLETVAGVRSVKRSDEIAGNLSRVNSLVSAVSVVLIGILVLVSIFLIHSTIATGIAVRRREISIMRLMGASDAFVRAPFIVEGLAIGVVGTVVPLIILYLTYGTVVEYMTGQFGIFSGDIGFLTRDEVFSILIPASFTIGVGIGFLGSFVTVRRNLKIAALALACCLTLTETLSYGGLTGSIFKETIAYADTIDELDKEIEEAKGEEKEASSRVKEIQSDIDDLEKSKADTLDYIEKLDKKTAAIEDKIEEYAAMIKTEKKELNEAQEELAQAQEDEAVQYDSMCLRIKYMYENGGVGSYLNLIFSSGSISELLGRAEYIEKISAYDKGLFTNYQAIRAEVEDLNTKISNKITELTGYREEEAAEKEGLELIEKEKEKEIKVYESSIADSATEKEEFEKAAAEAEKKVEELLRKKQEELAKQDDVGESTGDMRWPLRVSGRISSGFGPRNSPTAGASTYHKGIDIAVPMGTEIVAVADGVVGTATYSSSAGNYVMIAHSSSIATVYMHCSKLAVKAGAKVKRGDVVGYVGSTGISTGPHLHFGVMLNGEYVNPLGYVTQPKN